MLDYTIKNAKIKLSPKKSSSENAATNHCDQLLQQTDKLEGLSRSCMHTVS